MAKSRSIVDRLAALAVEHPWRCLIAALVMFFALAPGINKLHQDRGFRIWFNKGDKTVAELDHFEKQFGAESATLLIVHSESGIFDPDTAKLIIDLTDRMWKVDEVVRVESLANFSWVHAEGEDVLVEPLIDEQQELTPELLAKRREVALHHEQLPGYLISPDGKTTVIYAWLQPAIIEHKDDKNFDGDNDFIAHIKGVREVVKEFQNRGDNQLYVAGFPAMERYMQVEPGLEMQNLMPLILGTIVVLLLAAYRRPAGLLPIVAVFPSVLATLGVTGWMGIGMNPLTVMSPNIIVILAISSGVHLLQPYFRALSRGVDRREAVRHALEHTLSPNFFACFTTGIGFLGLIAMTIPPIRQLGAVVAIGTMIVWLFCYLLIGPLLVILPIKAKVKRGAGKESGSDDLDEPHPLALKITSWMDRHKYPILGIWIILIAVSGYLAIQNKVRWKPDDFFDPRTEVRQAQDFLKKHMGVNETLEIAVNAGEEEKIKDPEFMHKVEQLEDWVSKHEGIVEVVSLVDILKQTNRALHYGDNAYYKVPETRRGISDQYLLYTMNLPLGKNLNDRVTFRNDALRLTVLSRLETSPKLRKLKAEIRAKSKELGLDNVVVTGRLLVNHELNPRLVESVGRSIAAATFMIAVSLIIFFRSLRLGLLSLVPNIIPLIFGAGFIFRLMDQSYNMGTIPAFAIALGVAVDDTVHFLTGFKRLRAKGVPPRKAIITLWSTVVPAMVITTVILSACFGLFVMIVFPVLRALGVLVSFILIAAWLADAILLPCMLLALNRDKGDTPSVPRASAKEE